MSFKKKGRIDLLLLLLTVSFGVPLASANIDCNGKVFHCVNSTHFMICVDLGGGVSSTVDDFIIPCPQSTVCHENNRFECEFAPSTTSAPTRRPSEVTNENVLNNEGAITTSPAEADSTTISSTQNQTNVQVSESDLNSVSTTTLFDALVTSDIAYESTTGAIFSADIQNKSNVQDGESNTEGTTNYYIETTTEVFSSVISTQSQDYSENIDNVDVHNNEIVPNGGETDLLSSTTVTITTNTINDQSTIQFINNASIITSSQTEDDSTTTLSTQDQSDVQVVESNLNTLSTTTLSDVFVTSDKPHKETSEAILATDIDGELNSQGTTNYYLETTTEVVSSPRSTQSPDYTENIDQIDVNNEIVSNGSENNLSSSTTIKITSDTLNGQSRIQLINTASTITSIERESYSTTIPSTQNQSDIQVTESNLNTVSTTTSSNTFVTSDKVYEETTEAILDTVIQNIINVQDGELSTLGTTNYYPETTTDVFNSVISTQSQDYIENIDNIDFNNNETSLYVGENDLSSSTTITTTKDTNNDQPMIQLINNASVIISSQNEAVSTTTLSTDNRTNVQISERNSNSVSTTLSDVLPRSDKAYEVTTEALFATDIHNISNVQDGDFNTQKTTNYYPETSTDVFSSITNTPLQDFSNSNNLDIIYVNNNDALLNETVTDLPSEIFDELTNQNFTESFNNKNEDVLNQSINNLSTNDTYTTYGYIKAVTVAITDDIAVETNNSIQNTVMNVEINQANLNNIENASAGTVRYETLNTLTTNQMEYTTNSEKSIDKTPDNTEPEYDTTTEIALTLKENFDIKLIEDNNSTLTDHLNMLPETLINEITTPYEVTATFSTLSDIISPMLDTEGTTNNPHVEIQNTSKSLNITFTENFVNLSDDISEPSIIISTPRLDLSESISHLQSQGSAITTENTQDVYLTTTSSSVLLSNSNTVELANDNSGTDVTGSTLQSTTISSAPIQNSLTKSVPVQNLLETNTTFVFETTSLFNYEITTGTQNIQEVTTKADTTETFISPLFEDIVIQTITTITPSESQSLETNLLGKENILVHPVDTIITETTTYEGGIPNLIHELTTQTQSTKAHSGDSETASIQNTVILPDNTTENALLNRSVEIEQFDLNINGKSSSTFPNNLTIQDEETFTTTKITTDLPVTSSENILLIKSESEASTTSATNLIDTSVTLLNNDLITKATQKEDVTTSFDFDTSKNRSLEITNTTTNITANVKKTFYDPNEINSMTIPQVTETTTTLNGGTSSDQQLKSNLHINPSETEIGISETTIQIDNFTKEVSKVTLNRTSTVSEDNKLIFQNVYTDRNVSLESNTTDIILKDLVTKQANNSEETTPSTVIYTTSMWDIIPFNPLESLTLHHLNSPSNTNSVSAPALTTVTEFTELQISFNETPISAAIDTTSDMTTSELSNETNKEISDEYRKQFIKSDLTTLTQNVHTIPKGKLNISIFSMDTAAHDKGTRLFGLAKSNPLSSTSNIIVPMEKNANSQTLGTETVITSNNTEESVIKVSAISDEIKISTSYDKEILKSSISFDKIESLPEIDFKDKNNSESGNGAVFTIRNERPNTSTFTNVVETTTSVNNERLNSESILNSPQLISNMAKINFQPNVEPVSTQVDKAFKAGNVYSANAKHNVSNKSHKTSSTTLIQLSAGSDPSLHNNTNKLNIKVPTLQGTNILDNRSGDRVVTDTIETYTNKIDKHISNMTPLTGTRKRGVQESSTLTSIPKQKIDENVHIPRNKNNTTSVFDCQNHNRGRYGDRDDCRKFYICIGKRQPIIGACPIDTVFSEIKKQCTRNLSHCIRENIFQCVYEGRFSDFLKENTYYICIKNSQETFIKFKFQCQNGFQLNKETVKCIKNSEESDTDQSISSNDSKSKNKGERRKTGGNFKEHERSDSIENKFECEEEGKFADPNDCRMYYVCKTKKTVFRRRKKKCDKDKVFHKDKKKCVDADSYECSDSLS